MIDHVQIAKLLQGCRFHFTSERELQDGVAAALRKGDIVFERELSISPGDRPDFMVGEIAIEIKVKGGVGWVTRQLFRYAENPRVKAIVLVTSKASHKAMPAEMNGRPVSVVYPYNL